MKSSSSYKYKTFLQTYLFLGIAILLGIAIFNFIVDPLQFYRRSWYPPVYIKNQRYQNPGLAKNYDYDTVIIGNSHTENFLPGYIDKQLGMKALRLSMAGSTAREQALILHKALDTAKVRNIIWSVEFGSFAGDPKRMRNQEGEFPDYLYHENLTTHFIYLLSWNTIYLSVNALRGQGYHDLATLNTWYNQFSFSADRVWLAWQASQTKGEEMSVQVDLPNFDDTSATINLYLTDTVAHNPKVKFYLIFPPYSILAYIPYANCDFDTAYAQFREHIRFKEAVVSSVLLYDNVELYDFQPVSTITHDLNNYKDLTHFSLQINNYIIDSIKDGKHLITKANYPKLFDMLDRQVRTVLREGITEGSPFKHCLEQGQTLNASGM